MGADVVLPLESECTSHKEYLNGKNEFGFNKNPYHINGIFLGHPGQCFIPISKINNFKIVEKIIKNSTARYIYFYKSLGSWHFEYSDVCPKKSKNSKIFLCTHNFLKDLIVSFTPTQKLFKLTCLELEIWSNTEIFDSYLLTDIKKYLKIEK